MRCTEWLECVHAGSNVWDISGSTETGSNELGLDHAPEHKPPQHLRSTAECDSQAADARLTQVGPRSMPSPMAQSWVTNT